MDHEKESKEIWKSAGKVEGHFERVESRKLLLLHESSTFRYGNYLPSLSYHALTDPNSHSIPLRKTPPLSLASDLHRISGYLTLAL